MGLRWQGSQQEPRNGFAVRRLWADGAHDFVNFRLTREAADQQVDRDKRYWQKSGNRPMRHDVVPISSAEFDQHNRNHACRKPDCPQPTQVEADGATATERQ